MSRPLKLENMKGIHEGTSFGYLRWSCCITPDPNNRVLKLIPDYVSITSNAGLLYCHTKININLHYLILQSHTPYFK